MQLTLHLVHPTTSTELRNCYKQNLLRTELARAGGVRALDWQWRYTLFFLEQLYKNIKPQLVSKTRNILHTEMELKSQLFLILLCKPQKGICVLKINGEAGFSA